MIYVAVLTQMLVAITVCVIGVIWFKKQWMVYFVYLNNIGNPVIYYWFVPKFREATKAYFKKLRFRK